MEQRCIAPFFILPHDKAEITPRWIMYFFRALPLIATRTVSRMPVPPSSILQSVVHVAQLRGELPQLLSPDPAPRWLCIILCVWLCRQNVYVQRLLSQSTTCLRHNCSYYISYRDMQVIQWRFYDRYVHSTKLQRYASTDLYSPNRIYRSQDYSCDLFTSWILSRTK